MPTREAQEASPFLQVRGLRKSFGGAPALRDVDVDIDAGEVHGLIGANGAGKSTFIKILAGTVQPDEGRIEIDGRTVEITNAQQSKALGLGFIHQELNLIPKFSIAQNLGLGQWPANKVPFMLNKRALRRRAVEVMGQVGLEHSVNTQVETLSVADQWLVCIGRSLMHDVRFIAMDEPTASLSLAEADRLFELVLSLRRSGIAIAYVSHRLDEVLDLCNRVTIFRDGRSIETSLRSEISKESLIRTITRQELPELGATILSAGVRSAVAEQRSVAEPGKSLALEVSHLCQGTLQDLSFSIRTGEIVGLAGLVGAGRSRLLSILFGARTADAGEVRLAGKAVSFKSPNEAIAAGVALIPEERRRQGLILEKSVAFNLGLASMKQSSPVSWLPLYDRRRANRWAREIVGRLQIKCRDVNQPVGTLSGGNQQKVLFGRWLARPLKLLLLDEPTRGVDVGARAEIHAVVRRVASDGAGVLMVSSEFQELLTCDRVLVLRNGQLVGELTGDAITETNMTAYCFGEVVL